MEKKKDGEGIGCLEPFFKCLNGCNWTDDERTRVLIFLTECIAAALKVDAKLNT